MQTLSQKEGEEGQAIQGYGNSNKKTYFYLKQQIFCVWGMLDVVVYVCSVGDGDQKFLEVVSF